MSIKGKLLFILCVIGALLFAVAGFQVWNISQVSRQVNIVGPGIDYLRDVSGVRTRFYRQLHLLAHYFTFQEHGALAEIRDLSGEINSALRRLDEQAKQTRAGKNFGSMPHEPLGAGGVKQIENSYRRITGLIERAAALDASKPATARLIIDNDVQREAEDVFLKGLNEVALDKADEIMSAYDIIMVRMGALPWMGRAHLEQIQGTRKSIAYALVVDRLAMSLNQELNKVFAYSIQREPRILLESARAGFEVETAFRECKGVIRGQIGLGIEGEEEQLAIVDDLEREYVKLSALMQRSRDLTAHGKTQAAVSLMETRLRPQADDIVLPKLERIMTNSRAEITLDHRILLRSIYFAGAVSVGVILLLAALLFLLITQVVWRMLDSIRRLNTGADIVRKGDLDHAIFVDANDELGRLAVSFNRMTASLKDSNEDLRLFLFSLSHDLRSPLVNVSGFSGELAHELKELLSIIDRSAGSILPGDRERLQAILRTEIPATLGFIDGAAERMHDLVKAVQKLFLVGQLPFTMELLDMNELVRTCLGRFDGEIQQKGIAVRIVSLPPLTADRNAMQEIMGNLLDNAIKYLAPGRPGILEISGERTERETIYQVRDNGRGIAQEDLPKIFGLFRRVGEQDIPGDGMGLAYVKALLRRHGGRIWCESEAGAGTVFSISFPAARSLDNHAA